MKFYLAPMEGITTYIYRNAYNHYFGGIDKYFTPFIASKKMNRRERNEILPAHNQSLTVVPQILANRSEEFLKIAEKIAEYGYGTVNLNLGCPSGTVTARKRGAGFLGVPDELDRFLYEIYERSPLKISIKTRTLQIHAAHGDLPYCRLQAARDSTLLQWGRHIKRKI